MEEFCEFFWTLGALFVLFVLLVLCLCLCLCLCLRLWKLVGAICRVAVLLVWVLNRLIWPADLGCLGC